MDFDYNDYLFSCDNSNANLNEVYVYKKVIFHQEYYFITMNDITLHFCSSFRDMDDTLQGEFAGKKIHFCF